MIACPLSGYHHDSLARADRKAGRERTLEAFLDARRHREKLRLLRRIQSAAGTAARDCEVIVGVKSDAARGPHSVSALSSVVTPEYSQPIAMTRIVTCRLSLGLG